MAYSTPLHDPVAFFREPPDWATRGTVVLGLVLGMALGVVALYYLLGQVTAGTVEGTVTVQQPAYAPEGPGTVERPYGAVVAEGFTQLGKLVGFLVVSSWVLLVVAVHVSASVFDGRGSVFDSAAIAAYATIPSAIATALGGGLFAYAVATTGSSVVQGDSLAPLAETTASYGAVLGLIGVATVLWTALVCYCGLRGLHRQSDPSAGVTALALAVLGVLAVLW